MRADASARQRGWPMRVLRLCLRSWPADTRRRDGPALLQAFEDDLSGVSEAAGRLRAVGAEAASILAAGASMRRRALTARLAVRASDWAGDLGQAVRSLRRSPAFATAVSLTLAIGIGANAAVFGVVDRVLLTAPPYEDPASLVLVWSTLARSSDRYRVPAPDAAELVRRSDVFSGLAFVARAQDGAIETTDGSGTMHVRYARTTVDLLDVLGVGPLLGRGFGPDDATAARRDGMDAPGAVPLLLSHETWRTTFAADPGVVGRSTRLDGRPAHIIGVMPPTFVVEMPPAAGMGGAADVWTPLQAPLDAFYRTDGREVDQDTDNTGAVIARLREGVSLRDAAAAVSRVAAELREEVPSYAASDRDAVVRPMHEDATAHLRGLLTALLIGVVAVLLATCLNVSTLLLARADRRRRELALRSAIGASRGRILGLLAGESLVLAAFGALVSGAVAHGAALAMRRLRPPQMTGLAEVGPDAGTITLAVVAAAAGLLAFGLASARGVARPETALALGRDARHGAHGDGRARGALVAAQVAVSIVLVFATGLLLRTARDLGDADPGFEPRSALTFSLSTRMSARYPGPGEKARLMREIETALASLPGVQSVGVTAHLPLGGRAWTQPYGLPGESESERATRRADFRTVTSGYFDALGVRVLEGRSFQSDEDLYEERRVVIVDEKLADRLGGPRSAVGATLSFPLDGAIVEARVVGVVEHVRHETVAADGREALYVPYRQEASSEVSFVVRVDGEPIAIAPAVRQAVQEIDPEITVYGLGTLSGYVEAAIAPTRFATSILGVFAGLVLLSVAVGLYGIVSLSVSRRTREIGVRIAMGARRTTVLRSVLLQGARLAVPGAVAGMGLSLSLHRLLDGMVVGAPVADLTMWLGVLGVVFAVTLAAIVGPAHRASRLEPTIALKAE